MAILKESDANYYYTYILNTIKHTHMHTERNDARKIIIMIEDLKEIIIEYLKDVIDVEKEAKLFIEYIKSISYFILSIGNIALMLIAVIAWFTFNSINSIDNNNLNEWFKDNLKLIKSEYINSFTKVHNATVYEVMHSYSYILEKILIHKDFGYGSYKDLYIPVLLNRTISFRKENK